jgi:hypothetical protein
MAMILRRPALQAFRIALCLAATAGLCAAADDVAVLTSVKGSVVYNDGQQAREARAFMKLRGGDRLELPGGAGVRLVYTGDGRQETYAGPAAFVVKAGGSSPLQGAAPVVVQLPASASARIDKSAELLSLAQMSRPGGAVLRGLPRLAKPTDEAQLLEARRTYDELKRASPADDIGPELYLYSVLEEQGLRDEMKALKAKMRLMQPWNSALEDPSAR